MRGNLSFALLWGLITLLLLLPSSHLHATTVVAKVFHDTNEDGLHQPDEPVFPDIRLTNGRDVVFTGSDGTVSCTVDTTVYRFITMTIPSGYWPTTAWYHRVTGAAVDSVVFGLRHRPATAADVDSFRWGILADTQVQNPPDFPLEDVVATMNRIPRQPLFFVNLGDLVEDGDDTVQWDYYSSNISMWNGPMFSVVGNHDVPMDYEGLLDNYERYCGPPYYSFEVGNWHFMTCCTWKSTILVPEQDNWLIADAAAVPPGHHIVILNHYMIRDFDDDLMNFWHDLGVESVFSGHHHSANFSKLPNGMGDYNFTFPRGGRDWSPGSYALITSFPDGDLRFDIMRFNVDHRLLIANPQPGGTASDLDREVLVQAYDSAAQVVSVDGILISDGGTPVSLNFHPAGISLWSARLNAGMTTPVNYTLQVNATFEDGQMATAEASFAVAASAAGVPFTAEPWRMFRRTPDGASARPDPLIPPLRLVWHQPLPGMIVLQSPIVSDHTVFIGFRSEHDPDQAGIMAFRAETGTLLWHRHLCGGLAMAPCIIDGTLVATALADTIYGLDPATGAARYKIRVEDEQYMMAAPVTDGTVVTVGSRPWTMLIDPASGNELWTSSYLGKNWFEYQHTAPVFLPDRIVLNTCGIAGGTGGLCIIDRNSGQALVPNIIGDHRAPLFHDGHIYTLSSLDFRKQYLYCRDQMGNILWSGSDQLDRSVSAPAFAHDVIVTTGLHGEIVGLSPEDGTMLWSHPVGSAMMNVVYHRWGSSATVATPAIADSIAYIGSLDGYLYAIDITDGSELWKWFIGAPIGSSAAISGNMLFVAAGDGNLYAFTSDATSLTGIDGPEQDTTAQHMVVTSSGGSTTTIQWEQKRTAHALIAVYDLMGRKVTTLLDDIVAAGSHTLSWSGRDMAGRRCSAGVYLVRLSTGEYTTTKDVVIMR